MATIYVVMFDIIFYEYPHCRIHMCKFMSISDVILKQSRNYLRTLGTTVQELVLGQQTNINRYIRKVAFFEVRGPGSTTKPLSILIKHSVCIDIWPSYIADIVACWHRILFSDNRQIYID